MAVVPVTRSVSPAIVVPGQDWERLTLAGATATWDPNNIEDPNNRFADQGNGSILGGLIGGTATVDPGDAKGWSWRTRDLFGRNMTAGQLYQFFAQVRETTPPALADDSYVACGIANGETLNSATVEALGVAIVYTAGSRLCRTITVLNGVVSVNNGAANAGIRRAYGAAAVRGAVPRFVSLYGTGTEDTPATDLSLPSMAFDSAMSAGDLYWWLAFGRTTADADTVSLAHSAFVLAYPPPRSGLVPV